MRNKHLFRIMDAPGSGLNIFEIEFKLLLCVVVAA